MFCVKCGKRNSDGANFCKQCGAPIENRDEETMPPVVADPVSAPAPASMAGAHRKLAAGDVAGAIAECSATVAADPSDRDAHALLSTLLEQTGDLDGAVAAREKVVELAPDSAIDRDKLASLRAAAAAQRAHPRRAGVAALFETPAGAAVAAVGVMLVVLMVGSGIVWMHNARTPAPASPPPRPAIPSAADQTPTTPRVLFNPGIAVNSPPNPAAQTASPAGQPSANTTANAAPRTDYSGMAPAPAQVNTPPAQPLENDPRYAGRQGGGEAGTVHLPDNATDSNAGSPSNTGPARPATPPRDPGRIEIIVAGSGTPTKTSAPKDGNSAAQASQAQRTAALHQQMQGNYREALTAYKQALDGAGDGAPSIQQQIALCYQHLGDRKNAAAAYNDMIAGYRAQIAAGRNVDSAKVGIKAAQLGLKGIQ